MTRNLLVLCCFLSLLVSGACTETVVLDGSLTRIGVGDCVKSTELGEVEQMDAVDCDYPGALRVVDKFVISGYYEFPGRSTIDEIAYDRCPITSSTYLAPTRESWEGANDRLVICFE